MSDLNTEFEPLEDDEKVLEVLRDGRANPMLIREKTDLSKQRVYDALQRLVSAGWVRKVTRGLYELAEDPRD